MPSASERVERARLAARMSQRALADATGISQPTLSRIISGERTPKVPELLLIAQATGRAPAELLEANSVVDRVQSAARATADSAMEEMQRQLVHFLELDAYLDDQGLGRTIPFAAAEAPERGVPRDSVGVAEEDARERARAFRAAHELGVQPIGDLVTLIEQVERIDVAVVSATDDEHGLSMRDPQRQAVFIAVARTKAPMRQRSTLAHELGHVLFGDWQLGQPGQSPKWVETRADAFARHLLLPVEGLRLALGPRGHAQHDLASLSEVVQRFIVSPAIAAIAMAQSGYITDAQKEEWRAITARQLAARHGWLDQYSALIEDSNQARAPQRLLTRAITGHLEGVVSAQTIATMRGVPEDIVLADFAAAGINVQVGPRVVWAEAENLRAPELGDEALEALEALEAADGDS